MCFVIGKLEKQMETLKYINISKPKCGALRDLVPFVQFLKSEKHQWRSVKFSKVAGWSLQLKSTLLCECFSRFLNCTNGTKSRNASQICNWTINPFVHNAPFLYPLKRVRKFALRTNGLNWHLFSELSPSNKDSVQPTFTCSKSTIETPEYYMTSVQS